MAGHQKAWWRAFGSITLAGVAILASSEDLAAQNLDAPSESIWTRQTLLGDAGGVRENLAKAGIDVNFWITQTYGSVLAGDATSDGQYGAKATLTGNVDLGKLGAWSGLSLNVILEQQAGNDTNGIDGALLPANGIMAFPRVGGYDHDVSLTVSQRFNDTFSVSAGKFNLLHLVSKTPIVGGGAEETFLNAAMAGPITGVIPPYLLGAIANINTDHANYTVMVFDPRNAQDWDVIEKPFADGVNAVLSATVPLTINGLPGYYGLRGVYSSQEGIDLSRLPEIAELPQQSENTLTRSSRWYVNASVQQYLYQDPNRPGNGWGLFGYAAIADGNPNAIRWTAYGGLAGNSVLPGRESDKWGIGYFRYGLSSDLKDGLSALNLDIADEQGVEAFYNLHLTPWFQVTADVQWIDTFNPAADDDWLGTLRVRTVF